MAAFALSLLHYVVLVEGLAKIWPHVGIELEQIELISFSNNLGYSSLILYQDSTNSSSLNNSWNVESKIGFSYSVMLKCIGLPGTLNGSFALA